MKDETQNKTAPYEVWIDVGKRTGNLYTLRRTEEPEDDTIKAHRYLNEDGIKDIIQKRIDKLKEIDARYCKIRWNNSFPELDKKYAREASNEASFARHELERILKAITNHSNP